VKILNARSRGAFTTTLFKTGARVSDCMRFLPTLSGLFECGQSVTPKLVKLPTKARHSLRIDSIDAARAYLLIAHQPSLFQHPQVLRNRRAAYRKPLRQFPHRLRPVHQRSEDGEPRRISQRLTSGLKVSVHLP
jgi:hypothetical protein